MTPMRSRSKNARFSPLWAPMHEPSPTPRRRDVANTAPNKNAVTMFHQSPWGRANAALLATTAVSQPALATNASSSQAR
jgi:hypothetical protein